MLNDTGWTVTRPNQTKNGKMRLDYSRYFAVFIRSYLGMEQGL